MLSSADFAPAPVSSEAMSRPLSPPVTEESWDCIWKRLDTIPMPAKIRPPKQMTAPA